MKLYGTRYSDNARHGVKREAERRKGVSAPYRCLFNEIVFALSRRSRAMCLVYLCVCVSLRDAKCDMTARLYSENNPLPRQIYYGRSSLDGYTVQPEDFYFEWDANQISGISLKRSRSAATRIFVPDSNSKREPRFLSAETSNVLSDGVRQL